MKLQATGAGIPYEPSVKSQILSVEWVHEYFAVKSVLNISAKQSYRVLHMDTLYYGFIVRYVHVHIVHVPVHQCTRSI
jgi:hypothetical protein